MICIGSNSERISELGQELINIHWSLENSTAHQREGFFFFFPDLNDFDAVENTSDANRGGWSSRMRIYIGECSDDWK